MCKERPLIVGIFGGHLGQRIVHGQQLVFRAVAPEQSKNSITASLRGVLAAYRWKLSIWR